MYAGRSPYEYALSNPVRFIDPMGMGAIPPGDGEYDGQTHSDNDGDWKWNENNSTWGGVNGSPDIMYNDLNTPIVFSNKNDQKKIEIGQLLVLPYPTNNSSSTSNNDGFKLRLDYRGVTNDGMSGVAGSLINISKNNTRVYLGTARSGSPINIAGTKFYGNGKTYLNPSYVGSVGSKLSKGTGIVGYGIAATQIVHGMSQDNWTYGRNAQVATAGVAGGMAGAWIDA